MDFDLRFLTYELKYASTSLNAVDLFNFSSKRLIFVRVGKELPPFRTEENERCYCQDTPTTEYCKFMEIKGLTSIGDTIIFTWHWGTPINDKNFGYPVKVIKVSQVCKISFMDGFDKTY